jgi:hypothetical protein
MPQKNGTPFAKREPNVGCLIEQLDMWKLATLLDRSWRPRSWTAAATTASGRVQLVCALVFLGGLTG